MDRNDGDGDDGFTGGVLVTALAFMLMVAAVLFAWLMWSNASDGTRAFVSDRLRDAVALVLALAAFIWIRRTVRNRRKR